MKMVSSVIAAEARLSLVYCKRNHHNDGDSLSLTRKQGGKNISTQTFLSKL